MEQLMLSLILCLATTGQTVKCPARGGAGTSHTSAVTAGPPLAQMPTRRAGAAAERKGRIVAHGVAVTAGPNERPARMPARGAARPMPTSGNIAFQLKPGHPATGFDPQLYPGFRRITGADVYGVTARSPAEFARVLRRLESRDDLEWLEPVGPGDHGGTVASNH